MFSKLIHAIVLVTSQCNLNCGFCSAKWLKNDTDSLNDIEYYKIFNELSEMKVHSIALVGGEPLLCENIFSYIKYIKNRNIVVTMSTNGLLITEKTVLLLKECGVDRLQFSLDGPPNVHDKMRGCKGLFNQVIDGILLCKKYSLKSNIMMTVNEDNIEYVEEMLQLAKHLEVSIFIERMVGKKTPSFYARYAEVLLKISRSITYSTFVYTNDPYINMVINDITCNKNIYGGCTAGILSCTITSTGDVLACPNLPVVVGNIRNNSLRKIWEDSNLFKKLRHRELDPNSNCGICSQKKLCSGCRADAYCESKQFMGGDPICLVKK